MKDEQTYRSSPSVLDKWTTYDGVRYRLYDRGGFLVNTTISHAAAYAHALRMEREDRERS